MNLLISKTFPMFHVSCFIYFSYPFMLGLSKEGCLAV